MLHRWGRRWRRHRRAVRSCRALRSAFSLPAAFHFRPQGLGGFGRGPRRGATLGAGQPDHATARRRQHSKLLSRIAAGAGHTDGLMAPLRRQSAACTVRDLLAIDPGALCYVRRHRVGNRRRAGGGVPGRSSSNASIPASCARSRGSGSLYHFVFLFLVVLNLVAGFQALRTSMAVGLMMLPATHPELTAPLMRVMVTRSAAEPRRFSGYVGLH